MTFTYTVIPTDWLGIAPVLVLVGMTLVIMLIDLLLPHSGKRSKHTGPENFVILPLVSLLALAGAFAATIVLFLVAHPPRVFNEMIGADQGTLYAYLIILSACMLGILLSPAYLKRLNLVHQGEYYALILLATTGMMLMAAATSLFTIFLGIEMLSLALYILCGFVAQRKSSQEASMKYFLLSSFASAFLLYGIALAYGATGSTSFTGIAHFLATQPMTNGALTQSPMLLLIAMGLLAVGFAFKISAIPFQAWTPDVYQGAPAPVTAFMSVGTKTAALVAFVRVFDFALAPAKPDWLPIIWTIAILTIVGGNIMALVQSNVKRLLAYSSIAHAGYLLIGVVVGGTFGVGALLFYLSCYVFLNVGAFGVVSLLERADNSGNDAVDLRGLWYRQPALAGFLAFFLLALAGFPPMAGFAAKYALFYAAIQGGHPELLIIGVLASVLGMYYYLRVIATMFMEQETVALSSKDDLHNRLTASSLAPIAPKRLATKASSPRISTSLASGGAATAVAVKAPAIKVPPTPVPVEPALKKEQGHELAWMSWLALSLAALGTLAMGTALPFWLINLAQQAATTMLK